MDAMDVIRNFSPLVLAYEGDAVYELLVRTHLLETKRCSVNNLHKEAKAFVCAAAQSAAMELLEPVLTEEEADIFRRGRNAKSYSHPKNADVISYRRATGLEAVFGFLHLCGRERRIHELFEYILAARED